MYGGQNFSLSIAPKASRGERLVGSLPRCQGFTKPTHFDIWNLAMYHDKKVVVVMPAYNAAKTLRQTYSEVLEQQMVDRIILVDDRSRDDTVAVAQSLPGVQVHVHEINKGYGGNQKTCYRL